MDEFSDKLPVRECTFCHKMLHCGEPRVDDYSTKKLLSFHFPCYFVWREEILEIIRTTFCPLEDLEGGDS